MQVQAVPPQKEGQTVPQYLCIKGETVAKLPKYVVFKGDNDKYLAACWTENHEYLQFNTTDIGSERVRHEVVEVCNGIVMLKCLHWNKFWKRSPNWIWANTATADPSNKEMLFEPITVDEKRVALRSLGNNAFCKRLTIEGKTDCLNAGTPSMERFAILRVEEPIVSRRVYSIQYQLDKARKYDLEPGSLFKTTVKNPSDQPASLQVAYSYMQKKSTTWKCGVSFMTGVKTTFEAGIPLVVEGKLEVSAQVNVSREWGATEETQTTVTGTYTAPVKGGETVEVTVTGVHAKCDVPFSYIQEDWLTTGTKSVTRKGDGVFSGANTTDVKFEVHYL